MHSPPGATTTTATRSLHGAVIDTNSPTSANHVATLRWRTLDRPPAADALPFILLAPSFRFAPNRSRAFAKASLTNSSLPITAPSVKYLTRHRGIFAKAISFNTVSLPPLSKASAVFLVVWSCPPRLLAQRQPHQSAVQARDLASFFRIESHALVTKPRPHRAFLPLPFAPPPMASP